MGATLAICIMRCTATGYVGQNATLASFGYFSSFQIFFCAYSVAVAGSTLVLWTALPLTVILIYVELFACESVCECLW